MYIEFYKVKGCEYARQRTSIRKSGVVTHGESESLGRVLDRERLIFQNRKFGVYQFDAATGKRSPVPADFAARAARKNAKEKLIVDFGNAYCMEKFIEQKGLWPVIESVGYGNLDSVKACVLYYILENRSNSHAEDWYDGSYARILYPKATMSSQRISDMLGSIGDESACRKFFSEYIAYLKKETSGSNKGAILIDSTGLPNDIRLPVTAVSNHNGDVNNEVRLIYVVQRGTGLPIYMRYVPGNVVDVSTLLTTIAELKAMKVDTEFVILDAGYPSLPALDRLLEEKVSFLTRVKKTWKVYSDTLERHLPGLESKENLQVFNGRFVYVKRVEARLESGRTVHCYLGIDDARRSDERRALAKKAEEENIPPVEAQARMEKMGVFMLMASRRMETKDLLPLYYTRQDIEQAFDISKGYAKMPPLFVQAEGTFRGHLLMLFVKTIILRLLQQELKGTPYSLDDFLVLMRNQKAKVFDEFVIPAEATQKQSDIYGELHIRPELSLARKRPDTPIPLA